MFRTLCVVGAALAISAGTAGVALAADSVGPGSPACVQARQDVQAQEAKVNAENDPVKKAQLRAELNDLKAKRDRLCSGRPGGDHNWPDRDHNWPGRGDHWNGHDRDRWGRPIVVDCDNNRVLQGRYRGDWSGAADRYRTVLREVRSVSSDGGVRITEVESTRVRRSYTDWDNYGRRWRGIVEKRRSSCHDDGGDTTVITVERPPAEVHYVPVSTNSDSSVPTSSGSSGGDSLPSYSGGQVSQVPRGSVDTGDGSTEV